MSDDNRTSSTRARVLAASKQYFDRLLSLDESYLQRSFSLLLAGFVVTIISIGYTYNRDARLFPLFVAVPTLVMLLVLLSVQTIPPLRAYAERLGSSSMLGEEMGDDDTSWRGGSVMAVETVRVNAIRTLGWISIIAVSILLFGHVIGLTAALTAVFHYYSELSWVRAIGFALINVVLLAGLFLIVFNARLYPGIFLG